jgi:hypothetical protein
MFVIKMTIPKKNSKLKGSYYIGTHAYFIGIFTVLFVALAIFLVRTTTKTNIAIINTPNTDNDDDDNFERLDDIGIL